VHALRYLSVIGTGDNQHPNR